jgi:site-specific recombinase XerD
MSHHTLDLFDEPGCAADPHLFKEAFDGWLEHQRSRVARRITQDSSIRAYTALWQAFSEWCLSQSPSLGLDSLTQADLAQYIACRIEPAERARPSRLKDEGKFTARHVWRLLTLIDAVLDVRAQAAGLAPNRSASALLESREEWLYANANRRDELPKYLPPTEARILVNYLTAGMPRSGRRGDDISWHDLRNRTAVALHLGAGLSPADLRVLRIDSPLVRSGDPQGTPGTIRIPAHGDNAEREAPVIAWAGRLLAYWLQVRLQHQIQGHFLLPATRTGKPWAKVSHYEAVTKVLETSGIDQAFIEGGTFRLRHTFALRQLRRGKPADLVAKWLGVVEMRVMDRYQRVDYSAERPD